MSNKIYCLLSRKFFEKDIEYIKDRIDKKIELLIPENFSDKEFKKLPLNKIEIILGVPLKIEVLTLMKSLRFIQIPWTGIENVEVEKIKKIGIDIHNSHSNTDVVAEFGIAMMFSLLKKIPLHDKYLRKENWLRPIENSKEFYPPVVINGKTVTIVGFGSIGKKIATFLKPFYVKIIAIKNDIKQNEQDQDVELLNKKDIHKGLQKGEIIFVTVPLTAETTNLISSKEFQIMGKNTFLINISRGKVINERALFNSLNNKNIAGAAIDTWYNYPVRGTNIAKPSKYDFASLDNVILSPHRAGIAEGLMPHLNDVIENLNRYAKGQPLINKINLTRNY